LRFCVERSALATAGALPPAESVELERLGCPNCSMIDRQYRILGSDGFAALSAEAEYPLADENWDSAKALRNL
jgi:hypothetical protein